MKIFDTTPTAGQPIRSKMFFNAFLRMARAWENLRVNNGHVDWSNGMPTIVLDEVDEGGPTDEMTVVTDVQYNAATKQLQKKTRLVKVLFIDEELESEWTMITGGQAEDCP